MDTAAKSAPDYAGHSAAHTPGPWEYVPSNENHGPYVVNGWGAGDICDCYTMSRPSELAVCNGGTSKPIHFQHDEADANARLIAAAPELLDLLERASEADSPNEDIRTAWWEERAALIAKAEGRQL